MTMGDDKEIGGDVEVEEPVESGGPDGVVGDGAPTVAPVDPDYDLKVADLFRRRGVRMAQLCRWLATKAGMSVADAEDAYHDYIERVLRKRELDFSRNPESYLTNGFGMNVRSRAINLWRSGIRRGVVEAGFLEEIERDVLLDSRVSAEQEGKCLSVGTMEDFKSVVCRIFKRMSFRDACFFFLHYVCGLSLGFTAGLFGLKMGEYNRKLFHISLASFMSEAVDLKKSSVMGLSLIDVLMFDDSVIDMIRENLFDRAGFRREHREDTAVDYPLLRDLLGRPSSEFMEIIESVKEGRKHVVGRAQKAVRKAFEAALAE